jgi:uncharacterized protein (TIGR03067 family)
MRLPLFAAALAAFTVASVSAQNVAAEKQLKGTWALVSATHGGMRVPEDKIGKAAVTFDGDTMTMTEGESKKTAKYKLDTTKSPHLIDIHPQGGNDAGKVVRGLYEVKGDTLQLCFGRPDEARPTAIATKEGDRTVLAEFKKVK